MNDHSSPNGVVLPAKREDAETIEETLTDNAYNDILPARYLRKDENGDLIESPEDLFERVAKNVALADVLYAAERNGTTIEVTPDQYTETDERVEDALTRILSAGFGETDDRGIPITVVDESESDGIRADGAGDEE